jgi:flavin reductase (DIM6/NTAB) family NADH-FMN oxidoreductase RutF
MDPQEKKKALRMVSYGLYIATSRGADGSAAAGTINWVSQSSFEPPLVMVGIKRDSSLHAAIEGGGGFAINVLGKSQKNMAISFFKGGVLEGEKLNGFPCRAGETGAPILLDVPGWFECRVKDSVRRGDHTVFVAEVVNAGTHGDEEPLTIREAGFNYAG